MELFLPILIFSFLKKGRLIFFNVSQYGIHHVGQIEVGDDDIIQKFLQ